jgi:hypothetical protein
MHFMPDTEDEDSAAERFWPEGYKQVLREDFYQLIGAQLNDGKKLGHVYQQRYAERFSDLNQFTNKIASMVAVGAENGADGAFEDMMEAFLVESTLPEERKYFSYFWPQSFPPSIKNKLTQVIFDEYSQDDVYQHAYDAIYQDKFADFDEFINYVTRSVMIGTMNGADDMVATVYRSFVTPSPLPPARRYPRRLKLWAPI